MAALDLTVVSPLAVYLDEMSDSKLAPRAASLDGKVLGLLPNWRPSAIHILRSLGDLLQERYQLRIRVRPGVDGWPAGNSGHTRGVEELHRRVRPQGR